MFKSIIVIFSLLAISCTGKIDVALKTNNIKAPKTFGIIEREFSNRINSDIGIAPGSGEEIFSKKLYKEVRPIENVANYVSKFFEEKDYTTLISKNQKFVNQVDVIVKYEDFWQ